MTPKEWKDWIIGRRQALIDQKESMLFMAQANGLVEAGKSLKSLQKQIEKERYLVADKEDEYHEMKQRKMMENKRKRAAQMRGTRKFLNAMNNKSSRRG